MSCSIQRSGQDTFEPFDKDVLNPGATEDLTKLIKKFHALGKDNGPMLCVPLKEGAKVENEVAELGAIFKEEGTEETTVILAQNWSKNENDSELRRWC